MTRVARHQNIPVAEIQVRLDRETRATTDTPGGRRRVRIVRITRHVRIRGEMTAEQREELEDAGRNCHIANTLRASTVVDDLFEVA